MLGIAPPPPASPYGVVSNDIWAGEIRDGQAEAQARADGGRGEARRGRGSRPRCEAQYIDRGTVATLAARFARYADLTLITPQAPGHETMQTWVMNGALFESGRPILLLPKGAGGVSRGEDGDDRLGRQRRGVEGGARRDRADEGRPRRCTRC